MRYGTLATGHLRNDRECVQCKVVMPKGAEYYAVIYTKVGEQNRSFTIRMHWECLKPWCEERQRIKVEARKNKDWTKTPRIGRPPTGCTPEQLKLRKAVQFYLLDSKKAIIKAYEKGNGVRIHETWLRLAKWLRVYGDESQVGRTNQYTLGPEIRECLEEAGAIEFIEELAKTDKMPLDMARVIEEFCVITIVDSQVVGDVRVHDYKTVEVN